MRIAIVLLLCMPLLVLSQQTIEICNNSKAITYSTYSDIPSNIQWYCNGFSYSGNEITIVWDQVGVYTISVVADANGCSSAAQTFIVTVTECDPLVYWVPNTFTPNGDEFNTTWGPIFDGPFDTADFHLIVMNRWGNLVWESWNADTQWDGTYAGRKAHDGIYTWLIDFGMLDTDERKIIHGHVTIIR